MIPLRGRSTTTGWTQPRTDIWQIARPDDPRVSERALLLDDDGRTRDGAGLYISKDQFLSGPGPTVHVPDELGHLAPGDVVVVSDDGTRVNVAWKATATHNSILLTERCDHYCLMCSQPPKDGDDSYLYGRAKRIISALPFAAKAVSLTGGEPTIDPHAFLDLLEHIAATRPNLSTHILSNGRRFSDKAFTTEYASVAIEDMMVGIPLYAADPSLHDYIVQSEDAFNTSVKGILNLVAAGAGVEIRVVIQKANVAQLSELARYITRNLPFVNQVVLMGLEMTGLARPNTDLVWVDPHDYRRELREAYHLLSSAGIYTRIYNHQLCVVDRELWPAAVQSISDWKNDYPDLCQPCSVKDQCSGVFSTSGSRLSPNLRPIVDVEMSS
ncbi:MAG: Radical domain protein [Marmoricola sp.]|nr:Radical domain protein [Marmoricola sp.]